MCACQHAISSSSMSVFAKNFVKLPSSLCRASILTHEHVRLIRIFIDHSLSPSPPKKITRCKKKKTYRILRFIAVEQITHTRSSFVSLVILRNCFPFVEFFLFLKRIKIFIFFSLFPYFLTSFTMYRETIYFSFLVRLFFFFTFVRFLFFLCGRGILYLGANNQRARFVRV